MPREQQPNPTDMRTFARFYDATAPAVYGLALRITGDRARAADACEEAYAREWASGLAPDRDGVLSGVRDACRAFPESAPTLSGVPPEAAKAIDLPAAGIERRAVELVHLGQLRAEEAAELLGAPVDTVRKALRDGLLDLARRAASKSAEHGQSARK